MIELQNSLHKIIVYLTQTLFNNPPLTKAPYKYNNDMITKTLSIFLSFFIVTRRFFPESISARCSSTEALGREACKRRGFESMTLTWTTYEKKKNHGKSLKPEILNVRNKKVC